MYFQGDSGGTSKKKRYFQKYVKDWEKVPAFKPWVSESLLGTMYFYCKFCKSDNKCGKTELEKHMLSQKHIRNSKGPTVKVQVKYSIVLLGAQVWQHDAIFYSLRIQPVQKIFVVYFILK